MKQITKLLLLFLAVSVISCSKNSGYTIKVELPELAGAQLNLVQSVDGEMITLDSVTIDSLGNGELAGAVDTEEMMYLQQVGQRRSIQIFMGNYDYTVQGTLEDIDISATEGPQFIFNAYNEEMAPFSEKQKAILDSYYAAREAQTSEDSLNMIIEKYYAISDEKDVADSAYMVNNPGSIVSVYLLRNKYYSFDADELEAKLAAFDASVHETSYYIFLSKHAEKMKRVAIGQKYSDFELPDPSGNPVKLSDLAEKGVLLIDFWASWCGPCRRANPGVVEIYNEFHDQGFDILGVSLDSDRDKWLEAIEVDGLTWTHISDIQGWNCAASQDYAVSAIPHTVLLDKDGIIVARNLGEDELKEKIKELLGE